MSIKTEVAELKALLKTHGDRFAVFKDEQLIQNNKVKDILCKPHTLKYDGQVYSEDRSGYAQGFTCIRCERKLAICIRDLTDVHVRLIVAKDPEYYTEYLKDRYEAIRDAREEFPVEL